MDPRPRRPRFIPREAEVRDASGPGRAWCSEYFVGGRLVARVIWHDSGHPDWVQRFDVEGRLHGLERYHFEDGRKRWEARYAHGLQHGWQRQWDEDGALLCAARFVRGTGTDLWCGCGDVLSELREFVEGQRHGVEQWWDGPDRVHLELQFFQGQEHGITREWSHSGGLRRGFPKYFVHGLQVDGRRYRRLAGSDPTLPPYRREDDSPFRVPRFPEGCIPPPGFRSSGGATGRSSCGRSR